jgi:hypothetical protein
LLTHDEARWIAANIAKLPEYCSKRDRVNRLSRVILYEQGSIPRIITVLSQFPHNTMAVFRCRPTVRKMLTVLIVKRVASVADHKMVTRHAFLPVFMPQPQTARGLIGSLLFGQRGNALLVFFIAPS